MERTQLETAKIFRNMLEQHKFRIEEDIRQIDEEISRLEPKKYNIKKLKTENLCLNCGFLKSDCICRDTYN